MLSIWLDRLSSVIRLARLKFLIYSPVMYSVGATIAYVQDPARFDVRAYVLGLLFVYTTHVMTHFFNEYHDRFTDALNVGASPWTGGSRVLPEGRLKPATALAFGWVTLALSLAFLLLPRFGSVRGVAIAIIVLAWGYSSPPLHLEARALGEATVTAVLNILVPILGCQLQGGLASDVRLVWILIPLGFVEYVRMMVMNMADIEPDQRVNKKTLIVRLGLRRAIAVHRAGMVLAYLSLGVGAMLGLPAPLTFCIAATAPFAWWLCERMGQRVWIDDNPFWASQHNGLCMLMALVGLFLSQPRAFVGRGIMLFYPVIVVALVAPRMFAAGKKLLAVPRPTAT